jgi:molybdenum transport protein
VAEDVPYGDLTTRALGIGNRPGRIWFEARQSMIVACTEEAGRIMELAGASVTASIASETRVEAGGLILAPEGSAQALHAGWKVSQTVLETAGGIAASARAIVDAARQANPDIVVACTRKSTPGTRALSIKAVLCGGAVPHRLGLSETILAFAQHRVFLGGEPFSALIDRLRRRAPEKKVVVEADTLAEAMAIADAGADVVQIDKASPQDVATLRRRCDGRTPLPIVAAAGGINASNAIDYARAGADVLVTQDLGVERSRCTSRKADRGQGVGEEEADELGEPNVVWLLRMTPRRAFGPKRGAIYFQPILAGSE